MICSLLASIVSSTFKRALARPLLKERNLNTDIFNYYRPVSNLPFLSKIFRETCFFSVEWKNNVGEKFKFGLKMNDRTETALLKYASDLRCNLNSHKISVLELVGLNAAFDTVDHRILLNRLMHLVGLSGIIFNWLKSHFTDRSFLVGMDTLNQMWCAPRLNFRPDAF